MKITTKWKIVSNDGDVVCLKRDLEDSYQESTIQRPDNTDKKAWLDQWPVGLEIGNDAYHERMKFESARRKGAGVLTASEQRDLIRWNRPDGAIKQVLDVTESLRVFLENFGQISLLEYCRIIYIREATREGIAKDFSAISSAEDIQNFIIKYECPVDETMAELEALAVKAGLMPKEKQS